MYPEMIMVAEDALLIQFQPEISLDVNRSVLSLAHGLRQTHNPAIKEIVPTYRSLMIYFDPFTLDLHQIQHITSQVYENLADIILPEPRLFRLPTVYGGEHGPDLERVSEHTNLSPQEIIDIFSKETYPVYFLGFLCALAYLGGIPKEIQVSRLDSPRPQVPYGSVGFAGPQANILPITSPSGFNYIGRTFIKLYDSHEDPPVPMRPGDYITCPEVTENEARNAGKRNIDEFIENYTNH